MTDVFIPTEMPQKCYECFYEHDCELVNPYYVEEQRPVDCPLTEAKVDSRFSGVKDAVKQNIENTAYVAKQMYDECKLLGFNDKQAFQMATLYLKMKSGEDKVWMK